MTDYKKRIEKLCDRVCETPHQVEWLTDELLALLYQVEAETDRNSRIDELNGVLRFKEYIKKPLIRELQDRIKALAHREES